MHWAGSILSQPFFMPQTRKPTLDMVSKSGLIRALNELLGTENNHFDHSCQMQNWGVVWTQ